MSLKESDRLIIVELELEKADQNVGSDGSASASQIMGLGC